MEFQELALLAERISKIEASLANGIRKPYGKCEIITNRGELHNARIDYENDVTRQWIEIKLFLNDYAITEPVVINMSILTDNVKKLMYRGIKCQAIPFTHCTELSFIGPKEAYHDFCTRFDEVD